MAAPVAPPTIANVPVTSIAPPADVAERSAPTRRAAPAERSVTRTAAPAPQPVAQAAPTTPAAEAPATPPAATLAEPAPVAPVSSSIPAPAQQDTVTGDTDGTNGDVWGYLAGLLALIGIGGGAIALRRTRTRKSATMMAEARAADADYDRGLAGPHDRPQATTVTTPVPAPATTRLDQPVMQASSVAPMAAARPAPRKVPVAARGDLNIDERRLEEMIAQAPNRENPFKTRANRKRRALWLLRSYPMQSAA